MGRSVLLLVNQDKPDAMTAAEELRALINRKGKVVAELDATNDPLPKLPKADLIVVLGGDVVGEIHYAAMGRTGGFGSVKVRATIGDTTWETSLFPYKEVAGFALPVKAAVRKAEGLAVGDEVALTLRI